MSEENEVVSEDEKPQPDEETDIETMKIALAEERDKAESNYANWQRAEADFSNYKRRAEQAEQDRLNWVNAELIKCILPIVDDFDRAFATLSCEEGDANWVVGIRLIQRKLQMILEAQGLTEIDALGQPFDPSFHEAVAHHEGEEGMVVGEVQKGYKLKTKVLRPTLAVIGKGEVAKGDEEELTEI